MALNRNIVQSNWFLADASMSTSIPPSACESAFLFNGPELFADQNLLHCTDSFKNNDHCRLHMNIGAPNSHIDPKVEPYGLDSYSYLLEGEKVWFLAPPPSIIPFRHLFANRTPLDHESTSFADHHRLNIIAIHQKAGDAVYIPGGWIYVWQSVIQTIAFGSTYLRAWNLNHTIDYASEHSQQSVESGINIRGVFNTVKEGNWGVAPAELTSIDKRWSELTSNWVA